MKKILCVLLALMMVFSMSLAMAEESGKTVVYYDDALSYSFVVPEGYFLSSEVVDGDMAILIASDDETKAEYVMYIVPDDSYEGITRLNDMSEEDINAFAQSLNEDLSVPVYEIRETGLGTKLVVISENEAQMDIAMVATVYMGSILVTYVFHVDGSEITAADLDLGIQIYTDLEFVIPESK